MASPMPWYAVYRQSDNELVSVGDIVASDAVLAEKGLMKREYAERPDGEDKRWEGATKEFESFTPVVEDEFDIPKAIDFLIGLQAGMPSRPLVQTRIDNLITQIQGMR